MAKYTYQTISESGSFGHPDGSDVQYAYSKQGLKDALDDWADEHTKVGAERTDARLLIWKGGYNDVTDLYPDLELMFGPKGGYVFSPC